VGMTEGPLVICITFIFYNYLLLLNFFLNALLLAFSTLFFLLFFAGDLSTQREIAAGGA